MKRSDDSDKLGRRGDGSDLRDVPQRSLVRNGNGPLSVIPAFAGMTERGRGNDDLRGHSCLSSDGVLTHPAMCRISASPADSRAVEAHLPGHALMRQIRGVHGRQLLEFSPRRRAARRSPTALTRRSLVAVRAPRPRPSSSMIPRGRDRAERPRPRRPRVREIETSPVGVVVVRRAHRPRPVSLNRVGVRRIVDSLRMPGRPAEDLKLAKSVTVPLRRRGASISALGEVVLAHRQAR